MDSTTTTSSSSSSVQQPIAIVGIAAQLPSGSTAADNLDHKEFFDFLLNKGEAYEKIPLERFNIDSYHGREAGQVSTEHGTFLKDTEMLDHVELGITNKDARSMSLSTRKLIELSFLALLDSGIDYRSQNVGCFASGIVFDVLSLSDPDEFEARGSFGGPPAMIANRISYHLDLTGPSVPVDTACSSSLTATHLAVQAIRAGDCNAAVVGGVQLNHRFVDWVQYSQGGILAPDGKCKPFDASANGFSRGEAGVVIVLKRLDEALADGDHIYATILGTGINSAGSAAPVNAPVGAAQRDAMRRAWRQTGRSPSEVDFIELHATGTAAGDPAEANWVGEAFQRDDESSLVIGSVKGNIGHTEIAAFLSSLAKVVNVFRTGQIPPNVNFDTPNPAIKWDQYKLQVPTDVVPLPTRAKSGRALVAMSSSGIGGANGHVVLEAPPPTSAVAPTALPSTAPLLLVAAGLSPRTAAAIADTITSLVVAHPDRRALIATVYARRARQMTWRSFATYTPGQTTPPKFSTPALVPRAKPPVAFVFAGQGPQHLAMGRELYAAHPVFRASIQEMDDAYRNITGVSLLESTGLFVSSDAAPTVSLGAVWPIAITLPALAMLQCALVDLLASLGVKPDLVIGHSAGETAVFYASGAASKAMVVDLAIARGNAMALLEDDGGSMAALACGIPDAKALLAEARVTAHVDIACHNAADAVTLAGPVAALNTVVALAEARGIMARTLRTRVPVHSRMMERCREAYTQNVEAVFARHPGPHAPRVPVYSTLTGAAFPGPFSSDYFWAGTRGPVLFAEATAALLAAHPTATCLELSPHPVLASYLAALGAPAVVSPLRRPKRGEALTPVEAPALLDALGRLLALGHNAVDVAALHGRPALDPALALPPYPFNPKAVPYHAEAPAFYRQFQGRKGPLNFPGLRVNAQTHPVLAQHVIKGEPIMPAAGYLEMALEFGAMELWDVEFNAMMSLSAEKPTPVQVALDGIHWTVKTATASAGRKDDAVFDKIHAQGCLSLDAPTTEVGSVDLQAIQDRCERIDLTDFYEELKTFAEYGEAFQRVIDGYQGTNEVLVLVSGQDDLLDISGYIFHPAIMDCCLHFMVHNHFTLSTDRNVYYLPSRVGRLVMHTALVDFEFPDYLYAHIEFRSWTPETITADFHIVAIDGTPLCTLTNVEVQRHESAALSGADIAQRYDVALQPVAAPLREAEDDDIVLPGSAVDMNALHAYLDQQATQVIKDTLAADPKTGAEIDRQRYRDFALAAVAAAPVSPVHFDAATVREFERKWPEMMEVTSRLAAVHGKIFETSRAAVEVLYKDDIMTRFYRHYDWASKACAERFRDMLTSLVKAGKRVIRVLEVGSGTGALTRHLVDVLADFPSTVIELVISDVSKELLPRMPYPRARYTAFDLGKPADQQGLALASFDIIAGFDVLHVVPHMAPSLAELNRLLVPGGSLLVGDLSGAAFASAAPGAVFFNFVFGSFAEWFGFADGRTHCAMSGAEWRARLGDAGFGSVVTAAFEADPLLMTLEAQKTREVEVRPRAGPSAERVVFEYSRGVEGALRDAVAKRDSAAPLSLWLFAGAGLDGDAGVGLARSLAREYAAWDVHCVVFTGASDDHNKWRRAFVAQLAQTPTPEAVLHVDAHGAISVPRVVPTSTPTRRRAFHPALPWIASDSGVVQTSAPPPAADSVTVRVLAMSPPEQNFRGFVARTQSDELVVGVAHAPAFSNFLTVHPASVAALPPSAAHTAPAIAGAALGVALGALACGTSALLSTRRPRGGKALLSHVGPVAGPALRWFLQLLGVDVVAPKADSPAAIAALGTRFDFIVSGSAAHADKQGYTRALARNGRLLMWNSHGRDGLAAILRDDPLAVGEALDVAVERVAGLWPSESVGVSVDDISLPEAGTLVPSSASLFDSAKGYVLVGGIGGLGIRVALWMYQRGARYLVLTSRSGRDTLSRVQDRLALRIVDYLESRSDLTVRLEASDATSHTSTAKLLNSIPVQLGGCMMLSVQLSDRTFAFQDEDDWSKVFASKTGACRVIEKCIPNGVASLDFFVAFSSVVGLFGNGGQTNYSSANTALDGIARDWDNAFTIVLPAISDGGGLAAETGEQGGRLGHLTPWGMSAQRICDCIEDGIRKLADGPFWQYIPDLDWTLVNKYMGSAPLYSHLIYSTTEEGPSQAAESGKSLQDIVMELLDVDASEFSADVPFTAYGLDSLSAARLSLALRPHVAISQLQLLSDVSLNDLHERIESLAQEASEEQQPAGSEPSQQPSDVTPAKNPKVAEIEDMISKYSRGFKKHAGTQSSSPVDGEVVLVTGTTGAIGTATLAQLASMPSVARVYAFNRASAEGSTSLRERQVASLEAKGYDSGVLDGGKIVLVEGDQSASDLGIPSTLYDEIRDSVTSIIHNAWPVNFTASLASLEPAVRSVRVMADLALGSSRRVPPRLLFLSSIGLFYNRNGTDAAPEDPIADVTQVVGTGYTESKYVGERILEIAAEETALRPVVVRAGQICGGLTGSWSTTEWFPSLVKSSIRLGCLPEMEGDVSWVPLHAAAESLIDMRNADQQTLHISHPRPVSGALISGSLSEALNLPLVPYPEWLARLQQSAGEGLTQSEVEANPALGLLDYFRTLEVGSNASKEALGLPKLSVAEGVNASPALKGVESLTTRDAERWLTSWKDAGFLTI